MAAYIKHVVSLYGQPALGGQLTGLQNLSFITRTTSIIGAVFASNKYTRRYIHTEERLRIDLYRTWRQKRAMTLAVQRDQFIEEMSKNVSDDEVRILSEDVNNLLAVTDMSNLDLLEKAVKKLHRQVVTSTFTLGPSILMVYYILNQPEKAVALLKDKELSGFFQEVRTYAVAFQLLYNNGKYQEVLDLYSYHAKERSTGYEGQGYPSLWVIQLLASCFLLNTPESYKFALDLLQRMQAAGRNPTPRQRALIGALSLKQEHNDVAYEVCSPLAMRDRLPSQQGIAARSVQIVSLAKLGRIEEALKVMTQFSNITMRSGPLEVTHDTIDALSEAISKSGTESQKTDFDILKQRMISEGRFASTSLDALVVSPLPPMFGPSRSETDYRFSDRQAQATWGQPRAKEQQFVPRFSQSRPGFGNESSRWQQGSGFRQFGDRGGQFQQGFNQLQRGAGRFQQGGDQYQRNFGGGFQQGGREFQAGRLSGRQQWGPESRNDTGNPQWSNRGRGWQASRPTRFGSPHQAPENEDFEGEDTNDDYDKVK